MKPVIGFVGSSNSGKTSLVTQVVAKLKGLGFRVGTIKHAPHGFQFYKGKDSSQHKLAGAVVSIVAAPNMLGILMDTDRDPMPWELMGLMGNVDIVLVEGYKRLSIPKIEVFRPRSDSDRPICLGDPDLIAIVTSHPIHLEEGHLPIFRPEELDLIVDFILEKAGLKGNRLPVSP